jgi:hypothetical protein
VKVTKSRKKENIEKERNRRKKKKKKENTKIPRKTAGRDGG